MRNLTERLCATAYDGQVLLSARVAAPVESQVRLEEMGELMLKRLRQRSRASTSAAPSLGTASDQVGPATYPGPGLDAAVCDSIGEKTFVTGSGR